MLHEHRGRLLAVVERRGPLAWDQEICEQGSEALTAASLPTVLAAFDLLPESPTIADLIVYVQDLDYLPITGLYCLAMCSKLPEAVAFQTWLVAEFLPALRTHHWYDPERQHAIPPRHEARCLAFYKEFQAEISGKGPLSLELFEEYETAASYLD